MNKILLDKESVKELIIDKDSICNINNNLYIKELNITMKDNTTLVINDYKEIKKYNFKLNITQNNNTNIMYNHSFKVNDNYNLHINIKMLGNNSKNIINIHGVNDSGKSNIIVDGSVNDSTNNNELDENIKVLNINEGSSSVYPNMYINTKNVIANHSASISSIDKNYLFYMNSKGINNDLAKNLIVEGFLNNEARN